MGDANDWNNWYGYLEQADDLGIEVRDLPKNPSRIHYWRELQTMLFKINQAENPETE